GGMPGPADLRGLMAMLPAGDWQKIGRAAAPQVQLRDAATGRKLADLSGVHGQVQAVAFSPNGKLLAIAQMNTPGAVSAGVLDPRAMPTGVRLWDVENGRELRKLKVKSRGMQARSLAFSPDGKTLAVGGVGMVVDTDLIKAALGFLTSGKMSAEFQRAFSK